jgi:uncharacterized protein
MKIALIGASGFVGSVLLQEALGRGHSVTAIARNADKIEKADRVTAKAVDASDAKALAPAIAGHDVVVSAFNPGWGDPEIYNKHLDGSKAIITAAKQAGTRLIMIGGAGSLETAPGTQLVDSEQFPAEWKAGALAARDALTAIRNEKELDWTFVSPAIHLGPGEKTGKYRLAGDQPVFDAKGESRISAGDLAAAIVDEAETPRHSRKRFTLGY